MNVLSIDAWAGDDANLATGKLVVKHAITGRFKSLKIK